MCAIFVPVGVCLLVTLCEQVFLWYAFVRISLRMGVYLRASLSCALTHDTGGMHSARQCTHAHTQLLSLPLFLSLSLTHTHAHARTHERARVRTHTSVHTHLHTHTHTHTHIHTHTHTHTHTLVVQAVHDGHKLKNILCFVLFCFVYRGIGTLCRWMARSVLSRFLARRRGEGGRRWKRRW